MSGLSLGIVGHAWACPKICRVTFAAAEHAIDHGLEKARPRAILLSSSACKSLSLVSFLRITAVEIPSVPSG